MERKNIEFTKNISKIENLDQKQMVVPYESNANVINMYAKSNNSMYVAFDTDYSIYRYMRPINYNIDEQGTNEFQYVMVSALTGAFKNKTTYAKVLEVEFLPTQNVIDLGFNDYIGSYVKATDIDDTLGTNDVSYCYVLFDVDNTPINKIFIKQGDTYVDSGDTAKRNSTISEQFAINVDLTFQSELDEEEDIPTLELVVDSVNLTNTKALKNEQDILNNQTSITSNTNRIATNEIDIAQIIANKISEIIALREDKYPNEKAVKTYVDNEIAKIVDGSPETLDTLNELAKAMGDDPNFATTVSNELGLKAYKTYVDSQDSNLQTQISANKNAIDAATGIDTGTLIGRQEFENDKELQNQNIATNKSNTESNEQRISDLEKDAITRYKTELSYDTNVVDTMEINTKYVIPLKVDLQSEDINVIEAIAGDGFENVNAGVRVKIEEELLVNLTANLTNTGTNTNNATICLYRDEDGTLENATQLACKLIEIPKASINAGVAIGSLVFQDNVLTENLNKLFFLTLEIDNQLITLNNLTWKSQIGIPTDMSVYQKKQDNGLNTQDKTVIGGINELEQQVDDVLNGTLIVNKALKTATDRNIDDELNANTSNVTTNTASINALQTNKANTTDLQPKTSFEIIDSENTKLKDELGNEFTITDTPTIIENLQPTPNKPYTFTTTGGTYGAIGTGTSLVGDSNDVNFKINVVAGEKYYLKKTESFPVTPATSRMGIGWIDGLFAGTTITNSVGNELTKPNASQFSDVHSGIVTITTTQNDAFFYTRKSGSGTQTLENVLVVNLTKAGLQDKSVEELDTIFAEYFEDKIGLSNELVTGKALVEFVDPLEWKRVDGLTSGVLIPQSTDAVDAVEIPISTSFNQIYDYLIEFRIGNNDTREGQRFEIRGPSSGSSGGIMCGFRNGVVYGCNRVRVNDNIAFYYASQPNTYVYRVYARPALK